MLTRFRDVADAFRDWKTWSSQRRGNLLHDMPERIGRTLGTTDPPDHRFARGLVEKAFTRNTVEHLAPRIAALAHDLALEAASRGSLEFVDGVSAPFNAAILGAMFGVPTTTSCACGAGSTISSSARRVHPARNPSRRAAMRNLTEYLEALADERTSGSAEDLISTMLRAEEGGRRLSRERVVVTTMTFLTAGFESTNNLLTNLVYALALHPEVYRRVRATPELVPQFVEEGMRWDAAAQGFVRSPTRDVALHGATIPEGSQVLLHIGSANRDGRTFPNPDRFDLERSHNRHLGMGKGIHFCVGAPLARQMAQALIAAFVDASRTWEIDLANARRVATPNFRGFAVLPLRI